MASRLVCRGCGHVAADRDPYPFTCPRAGDGGDHVLRRVLDYAEVEFPPAGADEEPDPYLRYGDLFRACHLAREGGIGEVGYRDIVRRLGDQVLEVDGRRFEETPFLSHTDLGSAAGLAGGLLVKDETGNVAGSHKARHLFGVLCHLEVAEALGLADPDDRPPLAIASCGNAALAAAVLAAAAGRRLAVFVPAGADEVVVDRLRELGAELHVCARSAGEAGDPTYRALAEALAAGALPFTCQGNLNGLAVEGGETLGYEMVSALAREGLVLDHLVVQVGGGALASSLAAAFEEAKALGVVERLPRLHTVQTESAWPLKRAFDRVVELAEARGGPSAVASVLSEAPRRRSELMWPWETTPRSIAQGILDDETYDWLAVVEAMFASKGRPVVVGEEELERANALAAETTGIPVDATGSAGLAGLLRLRREGVVAPGDLAAVVFTGARRDRDLEGGGQRCS